MKKASVLFLNALIFSLLISSAFSSDFVQSKKTNSIVLDYTWFTDEDMTNPTGTICEVSDELDRLRNLFYGYAFSSSPGGGMHEYEWGHYPNHLNAIIYSDKP